MPTARRWATTTTAELAAGHLTSASERDRCDEKRRPVWAAASYAALLGENCCDLQRVSEERRQCPSIGEPMRSIRGVQQNERRRPAASPTTSNPSASSSARANDRNPAWSSTIRTVAATGKSSHATLRPASGVALLTGYHRGRPPRNKVCATGGSAIDAVAPFPESRGSPDNSGGRAAASSQEGVGQLGERDDAHQAAAQACHSVMSIASTGSPGAAFRYCSYLAVRSASA